MTNPLVSVITATYNRSNVLALAVETVRWQTFRDWELWVVGDACTDDTEQIVTSFNDERIHFLNLPQNVGEQSGPNNTGYQCAGGRYIAYLNHDDLWLPDHLQIAVAGLEETQADLVFTLVDAVNGPGANSLMGAIPTRVYEPGLIVPASSWLCRRELIDDVGPWRSYLESYSIPSQDWLYRAWKKGRVLRLIPELTVVAILSGTRQGVYANREVWENQLYFDRIRDEPDFRAKELTFMAVNYSTSWLRWYPVSTLILRAIRNALAKLSVAVGLDPIAVRNFFVYKRKGALIDGLRKTRGLAPLDRIRRD